MKTKSISLETEKTVCHFNNTDGFVNKICKYNLMDLEGIGKKAISNWVKAIIISLPEKTSQLIQHSFRITIMKISSRTTVKGITTSNIWWYEDMMIWCLILFSDWWRLFFLPNHGFHPFIWSSLNMIHPQFCVNILLCRPIRVVEMFYHGTAWLLRSPTEKGQLAPMSPGDSVSLELKIFSH